MLHGTDDERAPPGGYAADGGTNAGLGKPSQFRFYEGARHGFAVRTHPGYDERAAKLSFDEARRFLQTHLPA